MAPPASAAPVGATVDLPDAAIATTVHTNASNQAATDWVLTLTGDPTNGSTIQIELDDSDGTANCDSATDAVTFGGTPTATAVAPDTTTYTVLMAESNATCPGNDRMTITVQAQNGGATGDKIRVSGITYTVGADAERGAVRYEVNDAGGFLSTDTNAIISNVGVASAEPARLVGVGNDQAIGNIVLQEREIKAIPDAGACVVITSGNASFEADPLPTVNASGGDGVPGTVTSGGTALKFVVTDDSDTTATTYTLSGIQLSVSAPGPIYASSGPAPCGDADDHHFSNRVRLAFAGTVDRIQGGNRYATATQIAAKQFTNGDNNNDFAKCLVGRTVVIARGDNFADALSASYLAGKNRVPIFLTATNQIPPETLAALEQHGVTNIVLIGGIQAISQSVQDFFANTNATNCAGVATANKLLVSRIFGADRYQTAKNVALQPGPTAGGTFDNLGSDGCSAVKTAIVASGENFPDALAAGGLAYSGVAAGGCHGVNPTDDDGLPLLLTNAASLNSNASAGIVELGIQQVILLGGTGAVAPAVETAIDNLNGGAVNVIRVAGEAPNANRQGTAIAIANRLLGPEGAANWNQNGLSVSRPDEFPDALTAASFNGPNERPLYLAESTTNLGGATTGGISTYTGPLFFNATLLGGTGALSDSVFNQVKTAIASQPDS